MRWGILATGKIAAVFAADLALVDDNELVAVGSRSIESSRAFAERFATPGRPLPRAHGSYGDLAADPEVDVIYVATPHGRHVEDVMTCFEAGKAVLCEKAVALSAPEVQSLVDEARRRGLFFAEAMWMRCNPNVRRIQQLVADGGVGTVAQLRAELGFVASRDSARLWDPALGASSLLDVGIYPLTFAHLLLGEPTHIAAAGILAGGGQPGGGAGSGGGQPGGGAGSGGGQPGGAGSVDLSGGATLTYASGAVASIAWTQMAQSDNRGAVSGDAGRIEFGPRMHEPTSFTWTHGGSTETIAEPVVGRGYSHEIEEVAACLRDGRTESTLLPLDGTLSVMRQMDEIRRQIAGG